MAGLTEPCNMEQRSGWNFFGSLAFVAKSTMYLKSATPKNGWKPSVLPKFLNVHMIFTNSWEGSLTLHIPDTFVETNAEPLVPRTPELKICQY